MPAHTPQHGGRRTKATAAPHYAGCPANPLPCVHSPCMDHPQDQATAVLQAVPGLAALTLRSKYDIQWLPLLPALTSLSLDFQFDPDDYDGEWGWGREGGAVQYEAAQGGHEEVRGGAGQCEAVQGADAAGGRSSIVCTNLGRCHASR